MQRWHATLTRLESPGRMKIYTRRGDDGTTGLLGGRRTSKTDPLVEAIGALDELNAFVGVCRSAHPQSRVDNYLRALQHQLFKLGAALASVGSTSGNAFETPDVVWMEDQIDVITRELPPLENFILPGGSPAAAHLHAARAVCRRTERRLVNLEQADSANAVKYLNRLSDFLFSIARLENFLAGCEEEKWTAGS